MIKQKDIFKVVAKSKSGCIDTAILFLQADTLIHMGLTPNAFSPDGDGLNDEFKMALTVAPEKMRQPVLTFTTSISNLLTNPNFFLKAR